MKGNTPVKHELICMRFWSASEAAPSLHNLGSAVAEHNFTHPLWRLSVCNLKCLLARLLTLSVHQHIPRAFSDTCYLHTLKERQFFWAERQRSQYLWPSPASLSLTPLCRCRSPLPLPCHNTTPRARVLPALLSQLEKKTAAFNKLNFTPDRQDACGKVGITFKIFMNINFNLRALVRGEEWGRREQQVSYLQDSAQFPSSSGPGHFTLQAWVPRLPQAVKALVNLVLAG